MLFPERDDRVMMVMRRIIRGLCAYHKLGTAISDDRVIVRVERQQLSDDSLRDFVKFSLGDQFCRYWYLDARYRGSKIQFEWRFEFFGRTYFRGYVYAS